MSTSRAQVKVGEGPSSLLRCLKDPVHGGLFVFMDRGQQVFARQSEAPISIPPFELFENIRNTKRIAQVFGRLGLEQGTFSGLKGPPVRSVSCAADEAVVHG